MAKQRPFRPGFNGITARFPGVLRCVDPGEYWLWAGERGEAPEVIQDPLRQFCFDSDGSWCREQRAAGRCHLTDAQFGAVMLQQESDEEAMVPTTNIRPAVVWETWKGDISMRSITVDRNGMIRVSAAADQAIGRPEAVQLLYSASPRMIGLRAAPIEGEGAIRIRRKEGALGFQVSARPFLNYHRIDYATTRSWAAMEIGGVLAAELDGKPLSMRGRKAA